MHFLNIINRLDTTKARIMKHKDPKHPMIHWFELWTYTEFRVKQPRHRKTAPLPPTVQGRCVIVAMNVCEQHLLSSLIDIFWALHARTLPNYRLLLSGCFCSGAYF